MDIDFLCTCVYVHVVLLKAIYYAELEGMKSVQPEILHALICIILVNVREGHTQEKLELVSS